MKTKNEQFCIEVLCSKESWDEERNTYYVFHFDSVRWNWHLIINSEDAKIFKTKQTALKYFAMFDAYAKQHPDQFRCWRLVDLSKPIECTIVEEYDKIIRIAA